MVDPFFEDMIDDALNVHIYFLAEATDVRNLTVKDGRSSFLNANCIVIGGDDEIDIYYGLPLEMKEPCRICRSVKRYDYPIDRLLDQPSSRICRGDRIENLTSQARLTVQNCWFGKANMHLRLQIRGTRLIENCECGLPKILTGDMNFWFEPSPVHSGN